MIPRIMYAISYISVSQLKHKQKEVSIRRGRQYRLAVDVPGQQGYDEISGDEGSLKQ
jgi:hypothetical protein